MLEDWGLILRAIVDGPRAFLPAERIADVVASTCDDVNASLADMQDNGLVAEWPGFGWTLTPFAAESLHVTLREHSMTGRAYWGDPERPKRPTLEQRRATKASAEIVDQVPDPGPGPPAIAEAADEAAHWRPVRPFDADRLPRPVIMLTGCAVVWTERAAVVTGKKRPDRIGARRFPVASSPKHMPIQAGECSACNGSHLQPSMYCLRCDRWGFDGLCAAKRRAAQRAMAGAKGDDHKAKGKASA